MAKKFVIRARNHKDETLFYYLDWATGKESWTENLKQAVFFDKPEEAQAVLKGSVFTCKVTKRKGDNPPVMATLAMGVKTRNKRPYAEIGVCEIKAVKINEFPHVKYYGKRRR